MAPLRADSALTPGAEPATGTRAPKNFECPPELKGLRVLVVDDEAETRELLSYVLEQCDARVECAADAPTALARLQEGRFDVLVSDIGMPGMDGYQLIRAVRELSAERGGNIPALSLTAYARGEDRSKALRAGFNMHLAKPIDPGELLIVIATLINGFLRPR